MAFNVFDDCGLLVCNMNLSLDTPSSDSSVIEFVEQLTEISKAYTSQPTSSPELSSFLTHQYQFWLLWNNLLSNPPINIDLPPFPSPTEVSFASISASKQLQSISVVRNWCESILSSSHRYTPIINDRSSLMSATWSLVKSNQLSEAVNLLKKSNEFFLAATLIGTAQEQLIKEGDEILLIGNPDRIVNRFALRRLSMNSTDRFEAAIYGLLGGYPDAPLRVCENFYEYLWVLCVIFIENFKDFKASQHSIDWRSESPANIDSFLPPNSVGDDVTMSKIIDTVQNSSNPIISSQTKSPMIAYLTLLMLNEPSHVFASISSLLSQSKFSAQKFDLYGYYLNFGVNVILTQVLKSPDSINRTLAEDFIEKYCIFLIDAFTPEFNLQNFESEAQKDDYLALKFSNIAKYSSMIGSKSATVYSSLLSILPADLQSRAIHIASSFRIDSQSVARSASSFLYSRYSELSATPSDTSVKSLVDQCIQSLSFLLIDPSQRGEALMAANKMARGLLLNDRYDSAGAVLKHIPKDSSELMTSSWVKIGKKSLEVNAVHEYDCYIALCEAHRMYSLYKRGFSFSQRESRPTAQNVIDCILNCLLIDGGFLIDVESEAFSEGNRLTELDLLRKKHVPILIFNLHSLYKEQKMYQNCLELSELVTSPETHYLELFASDDLKRLLNAFADDSLLALEVC
ncbi:hypothetical protein RCL1_005553 [Eukaryota sp. TZLM3-RCL]